MKRKHTGLRPMPDIPALLEAVELVITVLEWPRDRLGRLDPAALPDSHDVHDKLARLAVKHRVLGVDYMEQCAGVLRAVTNNPKPKTR